MANYTNNIPVPTNPPAADVVNMQNNTIAVNDWVQVDHVGFNDAKSGYHNQVTFASNEPAPTLVNNAVANEFANVGIADSVNSQLFFQNKVVVTQLSAVRAWASVNANGTIKAKYPAGLTVVNTTGGSYTVTLPADYLGSTSTTNYAVIASCNLSSGPIPAFASYSLTSPTQFEIFTFAVSASTLNQQNTAFSFIVLQV